MPTLEELKRAVVGCQRCPLAQNRTQVVFGEGNPEAKIMFIGEGPGYYEDQQGRPFVGKAGQLLDKMLASIGLSRNEVYIANVVKCRPPNNRDPLPEEVEVCINYLRWQFKLIRPKIIVCLGAVAARNIIAPDFSITRERGKWVNKAGVWILPTYHPAALLRNPSKKRDSWEDLQSLQARYQELMPK